MSFPAAEDGRIYLKLESQEGLKQTLEEVRKAIGEEMT